METIVAEEGKRNSDHINKMEYFDFYYIYTRLAERIEKRNAEIEKQRNKTT